jgi:hypothetical protein
VSATFHSREQRASRYRAIVLVFTLNLLAGCTALAAQTAPSSAQAGQHTGTISPSGSSSPASPLRLIDVLLLRDGTSSSGKLGGCAVNVCVMGQTVVPREKIEWIGLNLRAGVQPVPPKIENPSSDEVHLLDRSVHSGAVVSVLATTVVTANATYKRLTVAWIHLSNAKASAQPKFPSDALWFGEVYGEDTVTYDGPPQVVHHYISNIRVRLREVKKGLTRVGSRIVSIDIGLINDGTQVKATYEGGACPGGRASATTTYTDDLTDRQEIWYPADPKTTNVEDARIASPGAYHLDFNPTNNWRCGQGQPQGFRLGSSSIQIGYLANPLTESEPLPERKEREAEDLDPEGYRYLSNNNTRMVGKYSALIPFSGGTEQRSVRWNICRAGSPSCSAAPVGMNPVP